VGAKFYYPHSLSDGNHRIHIRGKVLLELGERAFSVAAPKVWNTLGLPTDLKTATCSTDTFKRLLKTCLFKGPTTDIHIIISITILAVLCAIGLYLYCSG